MSTTRRYDKSSGESRRDPLVESHAALVRAIEQLVSGEDWRGMLDLAGRFHSYSAHNVCLIFAQRPEATRVAGYRTWQSLGRHVRAGEHGIAILAPSLSRPHSAEPASAEPIPAEPALAGELEGSGSSAAPAAVRVLRGFRIVHTFDLSQTEGEPLPEVAPVALEGDAPQALWELLANQVKAHGFHLLRGDYRPANGTTHYLARTVVVRSDLAPAQAVKTLAHETAHCLLHDGSEYARGGRAQVEIEAESVAYLLCAAAGVVTDSYSFPYVARWAEGDVELVRSTAERVITAARQLLVAMGLVPSKVEGGEVKG